ncbi:MAG: hypothetical protein KTR20_00940 [Cellvibrionaceae bacterium]|nr:hypothetical protein [Cellvibrionaceae bacterium]
MIESDDDLVAETTNRNLSTDSIAFNDETLIWAGKPAQIVNVWNYFCCLCAIVFSCYSLWYWHHELSIGYEYLTPYIVPFFQWIIIGSLLFILYCYLDVFYEKTIITHNKIHEQKGITRFFRHEKYCEISDIRDIKSPAPGIILGLCKLATVVIETNDDDQPIIMIRAIKNREKLVADILPVWRKLKLDRKGFFADR